MSSFPLIFKVINVLRTMGLYFCRHCCIHAYSLYGLRSIAVSGFKPQVLAVGSVEGVPSAKLFRLHLFWICTCFGMTVPYRIWFTRHCDYLRVSVVKETSNSPVAPVGDSSFRRWFSFQSSASEESLFRSIMQGLSLYNRETLLQDQFDEKSPIRDSTPSATETLVETILEDDVV